MQGRVQAEISDESDESKSPDAVFVGAIDMDDTEAVGVYYNCEDTVGRLYIVEELPAPPQRISEEEGYFYSDILEDFVSSSPQNEAVLSLINKQTLFGSREQRDYLMAKLNRVKQEQDALDFHNQLSGSQVFKRKSLS